MPSQKRIWIVGGSSGIGLEFTKLCLYANYQVVVSSRTATTNQTLLNLKKKYHDNIALINLDLSIKEQIKSSVIAAWESFDGLDTWFYNAGAYDMMSIDEWESEKFEQMNEVNYLGVVRLMILLLPYFTAQKKGHWVWNSSLSSYFGLPQGGGYSAPKAALVNLAESIYPELHSKNIELQIINHGFVKTGLTDKNNFEMPQLMSAKYTAKKIFKAIQNPNSFEIKFPFLLSLFLKTLAFLPYNISLKITKKMVP